MLTDFQEVFKYLIPRKSIHWRTIVPCGRMDEHTGMTKQIVVSHKFWERV